MKTTKKIICPHCGYKIKIITTFLETTEEIK